MATTVHRCIIPAAKASAGNTSIVQPLVVEEAALMAGGEIANLAAPQHVVGHIPHVAGPKDGDANQNHEVGDEDQEYPIGVSHE